MPITSINNFMGGLSLLEPSLIEDNQFEKLQNFYYNKDKKIQTRLGITTFGNPIGSTPITSYFFFKNDTTGNNMALCTAGTNMYEYDEGTGNWTSIKSGLSEFESDGFTRTRWSFAVYLNKVYMCNGVDAYAEYDGTTYTTLGTQPKCRYLRYMADSIYGAGDDSNPNTVYATTAGAVDGRTLNANDIIVGGDELGRINGMLDLGSLILIFKDKKIYSVSGDLTTSTAIDSQNGGYSNRAIKNVENAILYYNDAGIDRLKPRSGIAGASALASEPLGNDLRVLLDLVSAKQRNNNVGFYNTFLNNYYFSFDSTNDSIPDKTLIYSSLVNAWSQYTLPALYDYGYYIDTAGDYHYLITSANGGQMYEIETGYQDLGNAIDTELITKSWDFGDIAQWKTFDLVDIIGFKNEGSEINIEIYIDDEIVVQSVLNDDFINKDTTSSTIGTVSIGTQPLSGENTSNLLLYSYLIRIPFYYSGSKIKVRMYSNSNPNVWTLDKIKINREKEVIDLFPYNNIS